MNTMFTTEVVIPVLPWGLSMHLSLLLRTQGMVPFGSSDLYPHVLGYLSAQWVIIPIRPVIHLPRWSYMPSRGDAGPLGP